MNEFPRMQKAAEQKRDTLLDELSFHLKEAERIKQEIAFTLVDKSDSEHKEEQHLIAPILSKTQENPLFKKLKEEEEAIIQIKSKIATQNQ